MSGSVEQLEPLFLATMAKNPDVAGRVNSTKSTVAEDFRQVDRRKTTYVAQNGEGGVQAPRKVIGRHRADFPESRCS